MKKLFVLTVIFALALAGCEQPTDKKEQTPTPAITLPSLTIKNESSFDLTDVKFAGISFTSAGSNDLPRTTQAVKKLTANDMNKPGYITFIRKDIGIVCRTEAVSVANEDVTFIFLDTTVVEEVANSGNKGTLTQITFLSQVAVEHNALPVSRNDTVNLGEMVINTQKENEFILKNTGAGKLLFNVNEPVKITDDTAGVFSIIQPSSSKIESSDFLPFKIKFIPKAVQTYNATVTITSNDKNSPYTFSISAVGTPSKPIAVVIYENEVILQSGTINAGETYITLSESITVTIKNDGTETLAIDTANITITGADVVAFAKTTSPGGSISAGSKTSFFIECKPVKEGVNQAILTIPTNDDSRNPIIVFLKITGVKGTPVPALSQGNKAITNNTLTPVDFEIVEVGSSKTFTFIIKNNGNISLELTGEPIVLSSNAVFAISNQPANKTINPGNSVSFVIRFNPAVEGEVTGNITIADNTDAGQFVFPVKGTGYVKKPQITVKQNDDNITQNSQYIYEPLLVGKSADITFTIENTGDANLSITEVNGKLVNLADNQTGFYSVILQPSATVSSKGTTTFTVRFAPAAINANVTAYVQIKTNSQTNSDFTFRLSGNGRGYNIGEVGPGGGNIFYISGNEFKEVIDLPTLASWNVAKFFCANYQGGGFNDWYLPDIAELNLVYNNFHKNNSGFLDDDAYWSSSEPPNTNYAWYLDLYDGYQGGTLKTDDDLCVCAVRKFTL
jgi:hypothetical protein